MQLMSTNTMKDEKIHDSRSSKLPPQSRGSGEQSIRKKWKAAATHGTIKQVSAGQVATRI